MKLASQSMQQFGVHTYRTLAVFLIDGEEFLLNDEYFFPLLLFECRQWFSNFMTGL